MITNIFQVIQEYHMIEPGMHVVAGVSGGADSVCLLHVLAQYQRQVPFELSVVHIEHGLRGKESMDDAAFVERLCKEYRIPCRIVHARVRERMREEGMSCEEAGRAERYRIFETVRAELAAQRIAVAHNQNDQAETVLWNLARGSGLKGLGGIRPVQGKIIRPLLFSSRNEIEEYLRKVGLTWRTDSTNLESDYTRNRIRLSLLPQMENELNQQAVRHISEAAGRLREVQEYLEQKTDEAADRCIWQGKAKGRKLVLHEDPARWADTEVRLILEAYRKEDGIIRRELLKRALQLCGGGMKDVGSVHLEMLERLADMDCGKQCDLPGGICAVREEGILRFTRKNPDSSDLSDVDAILKPITLLIPGCSGYGNYSVITELTENTPELKKCFLEEKKYTKWLSYDTIGSNLQLRTRRAGDYLVINAQGGMKKLKDYFIDRKIPQTLRDQILLLADGSHILWVVGYRISEAAKVTEETKQVIKIQILQGEQK